MNIENIEDIVTSPETSKKLKELAIKQESLFSWINFYANDSLYLKESKLIKTEVEDGFAITFSAFTVNELLGIIPFPHTPDRKFSKTYDCRWMFDDMRLPNGGIVGDSLADCLANGLIHLIENGYVNVNKLG